jgi:hypothetical protein
LGRLKVTMQSKTDLEILAQIESEWLDPVPTIVTAKPHRRWLIPALLILSLVGNVWLGYALWNKGSPHNKKDVATYERKAPNQ